MQPSNPAQSTFDDIALQSAIDARRWHQTIDFGHGIVSNGNVRLSVGQALADIYFKDGMQGESFIDIGCWDGYNSFEAHKRGASRVLATDHFAWSERCWGDRASFDLARSVVAPAVEVMDIDLPDLTVEAVGRFDVALFAGVFYHLRHPFQMLEQIAPIADKLLIVETHLDALDLERPAMVFYPGRELADDPTNWWGPNPACISAMLMDLGFNCIEQTAHPVEPSRAIFHAYR